MMATSILMAIIIAAFITVFVFMSTVFSNAILFVFFHCSYFRLMWSLLLLWKRHTATATTAATPGPNVLRLVGQQKTLSVFLFNYARLILF